MIITPHPHRPMQLSLWAIQLWLRQREHTPICLPLMRGQVDASLWASADLVRIVLSLIAAAAIVRHLILRSKGTRKPYRRRTSHASAMAVDRNFLEEAAGLKQNVMNVLLFFEEAPTRADFKEMMMTLTAKYERMGAIPRFDADANGECVWHRIDSLDESVDRAVLLDSEFDEKCTDDVRPLNRAHVHIGTLMTAQDEKGLAMPLWRVVILSPKAVLFRIDHCISDGLSSVALLKAIGVKSSTHLPLSLSDVSPLLRAVEGAGDLRVSLLPLKLLWPPNLIRAVRFLAQSLSLEKEPPNPLRPLPADFGSPIPWSNYGVVYFPTMPLPLFKDMARAIGNGTTINDILLLCVSIAFGRYMDVLSQQGHPQYAAISKLNLLLPVGNPIRPSQYGDYYNGLCNRMTPIAVPLTIPRQETKGGASFSPKIAIQEISEYMNRAKRSNTPLLMTVLNTLLSPLISLDTLKEAAKHSFEGVSCVYSNVPGPTESISLQAPHSERSYKIDKIQVVMPHPVSILNILSYNSSIFFNITLDTRAAAQPSRLRNAFVEAVDCVAESTGVKAKWQKELASFNTSTEWGGNGTVYNCGVSESEASEVEPSVQYSPMPKAA